MVAVIVRTGRKKASSPSGRRAALPVTIITVMVSPMARPMPSMMAVSTPPRRSEEHTSELQSQFHLVCRLLLEKKKKKIKNITRVDEGREIDRAREADDAYL